MCPNPHAGAYLPGAIPERDVPGFLGFFRPDVLGPMAIRQLLVYVLVVFAIILPTLPPYNQLPANTSHSVATKLGKSICYPFQIFRFIII